MSRWICYFKSLTLRLKTKNDLTLSQLITCLAFQTHYLLYPSTKTFPTSNSFSVSIDPWFADMVNYLVTREAPSSWSKQHKYKFLSQVKYFYWEDPYPFKYRPDQIVRRCVPDTKICSVLLFCHDQACDGHFDPKKASKKCSKAAFISLIF